jgi:hypothetical protein
MMMSKKSQKKELRPKPRKGPIMDLEESSGTKEKYMTQETDHTFAWKDKPWGMDTIQTTNDPETDRGMEPRPRIAVVVVPYNTERDSPRGIRRYQGLVIHTKKSSKAARDAQPLIGMIIAELPQVVCGEEYMMLLTYSKEGP